MFNMCEKHFNYSMLTHRHRVTEQQQKRIAEAPKLHAVSWDILANSMDGVMSQIRSGEDAEGESLTRL